MKVFIKDFKTSMHSSSLCACMVICSFFMIDTLSYAAEKNMYTLEPIVVSAQKTLEDVQDIPAVVSVLSGEDIEDAGIKDLKDITRFIPNINMKQTGVETFMVIRGIGAEHAALAGPVGFYVDDVPRSNPYLDNMALYDVERVEILKGPQGTLYGKNSLSGIINVVTRQPGNELRGKISTEVNAYDVHGKYAPGYQLKASVDLPLAEDTLSLGLAGMFDGSDGYMTNTFNDDHRTKSEGWQHGRANLRWTPSDELEISFIAELSNGNNGIGYSRWSVDPSQNSATDAYEINWDGDNSWKTKFNSQTLRIKYAADAFDIVSVTGRTNAAVDMKHDFDSYPTAQVGDLLFIDNREGWSQEIRLSSPKDSTSPLSWVAGISGSIDDIEISTKFTDSVWTPANEQLQPDRDTDITRNTYAVFAQGTYTLWERLHLTAGLRYDYMDQKGKQKASAHNAFLVGAVTTPIAAATYEERMATGELLPKFAIAYDIMENIMVYSSVARGYQPGGFNFTQPKDDASFAYDSEYAWNYEAGIKSRLMDDKLQINMAIFYIDITDKQLLNTTSDPTYGRYRNVENIGQAHSQGVEVEVMWRILNGLDAYAGYGYTDARIDKWKFGNVDYAGNILPFAPKHNFNVGMQYQHLSGFFGRVDFLLASGFYATPDNFGSMDSNYELLNLRAGYRDESWEFTLWCDNALNREYGTVSNYGTLTGVLVEDSPPRSFGLTIAYTF